MELRKKVAYWTVAILNVLLSSIGVVAMFVGTFENSSQLAGFGAAVAMVNVIPTTSLVVWLTEER